MGNSTTRRLHRSAARIAGPALALLLAVPAAAAPAQAATTTPGTAGATWSQLMRRKLSLSAESVRLRTLLPTLRTTVISRNAEIAPAQRAQAAAATTLASATTADQNARARLTKGRTAAATATKAVTAALKHRPRSTTRIATAKKAQIKATATVRVRAETAGRTAAALRAARTAHTGAIAQADAATSAHQRAIKTVTDTQLKIALLPRRNTVLAGQVAAISKDVVTQTRGAFTVAQTVQVYGVTVNKIVAYPFQRMIEDAAKAGIPLSGGGFRTKQQQIALRTVNGCPDVWTAPSSSCRVPTAVPGRSLHEIGLAIDLTSDRKTINNRNSPAFKWLAANAGKYGFVNLPSEPWHWSITGN